MGALYGRVAVGRVTLCVELNLFVQFGCEAGNPQFTLGGVCALGTATCTGLAKPGGGYCIGGAWTGTGSSADVVPTPGPVRTNPDEDEVESW